MRIIFIVLGTTFGSVLYAVIWTIIFYFAFNYREIDTISYQLLFIAMFICFFVFGIIIAGTIFRLSSKRERDIISSALVYGFIFSLLLITAISYSGIFSTLRFEYFEYYFEYYIVLRILSIFQLVGIYIGVYVIAGTIFGLSSKRERDIIPSALVYGSIISLVLITLISFSGIFSILGSEYYILFGIAAIFQLVEINTSCLFKSNKYTVKTVSLKDITSAFLLNLILLLVICHNGFPGVNAPIEMRQKWAYKTFSHYPAMMRSIEESNEITDKVGNIKFIGPTKGRNLHYAEGGSSHPASDFTLEVVGEKGTGIAYITTWGGSVTGVCFEQKGKKIVLSKWGRRSC